MSEISVRVVTPSADDLNGLLPTIPSAEHAQHMVDSGALFVCAYRGEELVGVIWAVGDGRTWLSQVYVLPPARHRGVSRRIRKELVEEIAFRTKGKGFLYGFYRDEAFAEIRNQASDYGSIVPDAHVFSGYTGVLTIEGSA